MSVRKLSYKDVRARERKSLFLVYALNILCMFCCEKRYMSANATTNVLALGPAAAACALGDVSGSHLAAGSRPGADSPAVDSPAADSPAAFHPVLVAYSGKRRPQRQGSCSPS